MSIQPNVSPEYIIFADEPINTIVNRSKLYNGSIYNFHHRISDNFIIRINNKLSIYGTYTMNIDLSKKNDIISLAILNVSIDLDTFKITLKNYNKEILNYLLTTQTKITPIDKIKRKLLKKVIKLTDKYNI